MKSVLSFVSQVSLLLIAAAFTVSCSPKKTEPVVKVPPEEMPHYRYYRMGGNWYKFPTGSKYPHIYGYTLKPGALQKVTEEYLKSEVVIDDYEEFYFSRCCNDRMQAYYPDLVADNLRWRNSLWVNLSLSPVFEPHQTTRYFFNNGESLKYRLLDYNDDFYIFEDVKTGHKYYNYLSKRPLYFDQHILIGDGKRFVRSVPLKSLETFELFESQYPYVWADSPGVVFKINSDSGGNEFNTDRVSIFEKFVREVYVGPELPEGVEP